jgi:hypothetical protein
MHDRDRLVFYPFVAVRIAGRVCTRSGSYRLARLAAKYGPEITLRELTDRLSSTITGTGNRLRCEAQVQALLHVPIA